MSHTPGPWEMDGPCLVGNGYGIGHVNSHNTSEGKANARLIAAAPELLEALQWIERNQGAHRNNIRAVVLDAIAKATNA